MFDVLSEVDILLVAGRSAGILATIVAAQCGADVLLILTLDAGVQPHNVPTAELRVALLKTKGSS